MPPITWGDIMVALTVAGGILLQTQKLSRWQGKVDTLLETFGERIKAIERAMHWDGTERRGHDRTS